MLEKFSRSAHGLLTAKSHWNTQMTWVAELAELQEEVVNSSELRPQVKFFANPWDCVCRIRRFHHQGSQSGLTWLVALAMPWQT